MRIDKIEVFHANGGWRPWTFVKILTSDGLVGWSECSDSHGSPKGIEGVINDLSGLILGKDPLLINQILCLIYSRTRQSKGSIIQKAISGIENALWDIKAKSMNCPVNSLFGGDLRKNINLYWSHCGTSRVRASNLIKKPQISNFDDLRIFTDEIKKSGFNAIKTNIAILDENPSIYMPGFAKSIGFPELNMSRKLEDNLVLWISNFREYLGNQFEIALDLNFNFRTDGYIKIAKLLEEYNLAWLEIDLYNEKSLRFIRDKINIPISSCENLYGLSQFKPFFDSESIDICSIDVIWNGFLESIKIANLAELNNINVTCHNFNGHLSSFISMHFCSLISNFRIAEFDVDDVPWKDELFSHKPIINNGNFEFNNRPGWGCDVNENALRKYLWE